MAQTKKFTKHKYNVGKEVMKPDGRIGKVLKASFNYPDGWVYKVSSKAVDIAKMEVIEGVVTLLEKEIKPIK